MTFPKSCVDNPREIFDSYNGEERVIPLEVCKSKEGVIGFYYHFLPEFNPALFAKLKPEDVAIDLIDLCDKNLKKLPYLATISTPAYSMGKGTIDKDQCIYLSWIEFWCASLWYQLPEEHLFRLEQVLDVLKLMYDKQGYILMEIIELILQVCLNYGTPDMIITVYQSLPLFKIKPSGRICSIYFQAILNSQKARAARTQESIKELMALNKQVHGKKPGSSLNPMLRYYKEATKNFQQRTFCTEKELNIIGDRALVFTDVNICSNCKKALKYEDIFKQSNTTQEETRCCYCKAILIPHMEYRIGDRYRYCEPKVKTYTEQSTVLSSPYEFKKSIENLALQATRKLKADIMMMRMFYQNILWNLIFHFSELGLPYDLFLPYKKDVYYEKVVANVPSVTLTTIDKWEAEDKNEFNMQNQYEEKIRTKIAHKHIGTQCNMEDKTKQ